MRPLYDDKSANNSTVTRDYVFELDAPDGQAPILSIFGGKITTYRKLAEHALAKLGGLGGEAWTAGAYLPGGDLGGADFRTFASGLVQNNPDLAPDVILRLARAYGSDAAVILARDNLGDEVAPGLFEAELNYLIEHEFVSCADDALWRRSKLGLHYTPTQRQAVADWFAS